MCQKFFIVRLIRANYEKRPKRPPTGPALGYGACLQYSSALTERMRLQVGVMQADCPSYLAY